MEPDPIIPKPPELLTALANFHPLHHIIPAWIMGYLILNRLVIWFLVNIELFQAKLIIKQLS